MTIGWRLGIVAIQLAILIIASWSVTGQPVLLESWYLAGLLAVIVNPLLLEPYYPRPGDVIANGLIFLFFYGAEISDGTTDLTTTGWHIAAGFAVLATSLAIMGVTLGQRNNASRLRGLGRATRQLSQLATARVFYSAAFLLSVTGSYPQFEEDFWALVATWAGLITLGSINWQSLWASATGSAPACKIEGNLGPSVLLISAPDIPVAGSWVRLRSRTTEAEGIILNRIRRSSDAFGEIHIRAAEDWESLLAGGTPHLESVSIPPAEFVGSVGVGSTDRTLCFTATTPLEVGEVVSVEGSDEQPAINYQIVAAEIIRSSTTEGAAQLYVDTKANQLGIFDEESLRLVPHRWTPPPGAAIFRHKDTVHDEDAATIETFRLGTVIGTRIPVFLDLKGVCEGHLVILGMTKMGKTTLASRLARALASSRNVTILDQTGEWVNRRGLTPLQSNRNWCASGLEVFEPKSGEIPADRALKFIKFLLKQAIEEYKIREPYPRTLIIDEAHQFVPEPAGLGFKAPGRDSSYSIGLLMMQIRKYGLSIFLISQRTAVLAKSALSQCENLIAFRSVDQTGLDYLEALAGPNVRHLLPQLKQGEALVFGPAVSSDGPVAIKIERESAPEDEAPPAGVTTEPEPEPEEASGTENSSDGEP